MARVRFPVWECLYHNFFFLFDCFKKNHTLSNIFIQERFCPYSLLPLSNYVPSHLMQQPKSCFIWMVKVLDFHLSSKIRNQIEDSNLNHFTGNLRSKRFQSIYCAKVRAEAKKSYAGYFTGNVRTWSSNDLQIVGQQSGFRIQLFRRLRMQPEKEKFLTPQIKFRRLSAIHLPHGLVVRIRRSHRRGPGSIPGVGMSIQFFNFIFIYQRFKKS